MAASRAIGWLFDRGKRAGVLKARFRKIRSQNFSFFRFESSVDALENQEPRYNSSRRVQATSDYGSSFFILELSVGQAREPRDGQLLKNEASISSGRQTCFWPSQPSTQLCLSCVEALPPFSTVARMQKCMPENDETIPLSQPHL